MRQSPSGQILNKAKAIAFASSSVPLTIAAQGFHGVAITYPGAKTNDSAIVNQDANTYEASLSVQAIVSEDDQVQLFIQNNGSLDFTTDTDLIFWVMVLPSN